MSIKIFSSIPEALDRFEVTRPQNESHPDLTMIARVLNNFQAPRNLPRIPPDEWNSEAWATAVKLGFVALAKSANEGIGKLVAAGIIEIMLNPKSRSTDKDLAETALILMNHYLGGFNDDN